MKGPMSLRVFSTMSRKVETFLLSFKAPEDKSLSTRDKSLCSHRKEGGRASNISTCRERQETESESQTEAYFEAAYHLRST